MRYLGNKSRMIDNIDLFLRDLKINGETFCDLFAGSSSVSDFFKDKYHIIANDLLASSCVFASAKLSFSDIPKFENFINKYGVSPFVYFTNKNYRKLSNHFIWNNYSPKGGRQFFTEEIANKIDGIRIDLDKLLKANSINKKEYDFLLASLLETVMGLSNTTGTYEAFLKKWDKRSFKQFELIPLNIEHKKLFSEKNEIYNEDANELIKKISGDILYLDTPYTITDYNSAYHLLETIVKYDNPEIRGITGRRSNKPEKSKYSSSSKVATAYEELIKNANFEHIIISYSTQSLLPIDKLLEILKKYTKDEIVVKYFPFREYRNIRSSQKEEKLSEVLIYLHKTIKAQNGKEKSIIKSPLNYSGSKNYIVDQIIDEIPSEIETFVDCMGGAFNVGINVQNVDTLVYNEYNPFVFDIVDMLLKCDKNKLIKDVKNIIKENQLEKGNKENYLKFRKYYNQNKTPLHLFVLQMFCFQNQLRFNNKHDFNTPVGNCGCNQSTFDRINTFIPNCKNLLTTNMDFFDIDIKKFDSSTLFYFDPPYIITNATYNDGKRGFEGWTEEQEKKLLEFLDKINSNKQKFLLSNVINHNGKTNYMLKEWAERNGYNIVYLKPHRGRYGAREEVLVKNY